MEQNMGRSGDVSSAAAAREVEKESKGWVIGLIACVVVAVASIVWGICATVISSNKAAEIAKLEDQITEKDETIASLKKSETSIGEEDDPLAVEPSVNSYSIFADNLAKNFSGTVFGYYYHYTGTENVKRSVGADVKDGHLTITDLENNNQIMAEADDIISVYFITVGNGGVPYFYMINKDGKVSRIGLLEGADRTIEPLNDYKDIVSVVQGGDLFAWLIDINGNIYKSA